MTRSEFNPYLNMTYIKLDKTGNAYCLENGRYIRNRSIDETIDDIIELEDDVLNPLDKRLDIVIARFELYIIAGPYELN